MKTSAETVLLVLALGVIPGFALGAPQGSRCDSYVLARGSNTMMSGSLDDLQDLRSLYPTPFLWFRRDGKAYVLRDTKLLDQAQALFEPLRSLDPEQEHLAAREADLDREEEALDRVEDSLDAADEDDEDISEEDSSSASQSVAPAELAERQRELASRQADVARRQRELAREEQSLDSREEALEAAAEGSLWKLIDQAIRSGAASPAEPR